MKRYKLTKTNEPQNFCTKVQLTNFTLYLNECEDGKTLKELGKDYYDILLMLMNHQSLTDFNKL
jgi:hypothetical protein